LPPSKAISRSSSGDSIQTCRRSSIPAWTQTHKAELGRRAPRTSRRTTTTSMEASLGRLFRGPRTRDGRRREWRNMALLLDQPPPDHQGRVPGARSELQPAPDRIAVGLERDAEARARRASATAGVGDITAFQAADPRQHGLGVPLVPRRAVDVHFGKELFCFVLCVRWLLRESDS
jgi:hypothetical protein